ncbi:MAG: NAD+ synthase, partial [Chloroflexi bacterium]|nr:NAD+ synthase [Chloroflexota bacterium]
MPDLRIGLAQINVAVGDLDGNVAKILEYAGRAREQGCDIVAFPELAVTGYPPEDLLLRRRFVLDNLAALERIVERAPKEIALVVGFVDAREGESAIYNAAAVIRDGRTVEVYRKHLLPNYGVFDEDRYFQPGTETPVLQVAAGRFGVTVCEDIWFEDGPQRPLVQAGAEVIVNINGSPYYAGRGREREEMLAARAKDIGAPVCYVNLVGGQDELVFDGGSVVVNERGDVIARAAVFEEELLVCDLGEAKPAARIVAPLTEEAEVYAALVTGTRDYVAKVGFENVYVGLSGGVDSSLVATLAADALGPGHVVAVAMPSRYSSEGSIADARELAEHL